MNITVYLGANFGKDPAYKEAVMQLGTWIAKAGHTLVYGGSKSGLMGVLADCARKENGYVIGVEVPMFIQQEVQHTGLSELLVVEDISARKKKMMELGDAFVAFPGGTGTLEEIAEVMSQVSLKQMHVPCIFYNLNGYYDNIKFMLQTMIEQGFSDKSRQEGIYFADNLKDIQTILKQYQ